MAITLVTAIHIFICLMLIALVLLQQGKGADVGATFGGGGNTMFGASGADNFLTRFTTVMAIAFMCTSVFLGVSAKEATSSTGELFQGAPVDVNAVPDTAEVPAADPAPDAAPIADTANSKPAAAPAASAEPAATKAAPTKAAPPASPPAEEVADEKGEAKK